MTIGSSSPHLSEQTHGWLDAALARSVDVAIIFFMPNGLVADWIGAAERMFGYSRSEALGMPFSALFTEQDKALGLDTQELMLAISSGRSEDDRWHVRKNRGTFWASGVLTTVRDDQGKVVALCKFVRDRTDIKTQLQALENQVTERAADIERRDRVATALAHELLNPLMPIMSAVAVLQKSEDATLRARACEIIDRQVGVLKGLIGDLNDRGRAVAARALIAPERLSVNNALRESADGLRAGAEARGLRIQVVLPGEALWINADPLRLQQMLLNLIGNAIKYTPPGGQITLSATVEGDMAVIRVEDDGAGIAPDVLPRIFELFTREKRVAHVPGMGVGLAVVQDLARRHGGSVEARSPGVGLGSIFGLRLPLFTVSRPAPDADVLP